MAGETPGKATVHLPQCLCSCLHASLWSLICNAWKHICNTVHV